jgi:hypothetical protein
MESLVGRTLGKYELTAMIGGGTFTEGKMGFYVGTFDASNFTVNFDEFAIWAPIVY